jgi:hypothetical protein
MFRIREVDNLAITLFEGSVHRMLQTLVANTKM